MRDDVLLIRYVSDPEQTKSHDRDDCDEKDDRKSTEGDVGLVIIDILRSL